MAEQAESNAGWDIVRKGRVIMLITLASRPLGFLREAVQAALFGTSPHNDAFVVAHNIPDVLETLLYTGVLSHFFVPVITGFREDRATYSKIFSVMINLSFLVSVAVAGVCFWAAEPILRLVAPRLESMAVAVLLFRLMLPAMALHSVLAVMRGALNALDHYAMPELAGIALNVCFIAAALSLVGVLSLPIAALAYGVLIGAGVQVLIQIPALIKNRVRFRFVFGLGHPAFRTMGRLAVGAVIASAVVPVNSLVDKAFASFLPSGRISALQYGFRVFLLPFSLFAVPVYTVLLTGLSARYHRKDRDGLKDSVGAGLKLIWLTMLPAGALLAALSLPVVRVLFERGSFTAADSLLVAQALAAYSLGLFAYGGAQIMIKTFNAAHDTLTPALVAVAALLLNAVLDWFFMRAFGHWGIALVTSLVSTFNAAALYLLFRRRFGPLDEKAIAVSFLKNAAAAALAGGAVLAGARLAGLGAGPIWAPGPMAAFLAIGLLGIGVFAAAAHILGVEEIGQLAAIMKRRFSR